MANQRRGYDAELKCFNHLLTRNHIVFRSAASKGPFDIVAIGDGGTYFIQVKRTKEPSRRRHNKELTKLRAMNLFDDKRAIQLWCWVDFEGWYVIDIGRTPEEDVERWMGEGDEYRQVKNFGPLAIDQQWLALDEASNNMRPKLQ